MLTFLGVPKSTPQGITRRELLQAGAMGFGGLALADLLRGEELNALTGAPRQFGRAKSCIVLHLYGAWSQLDTFDMKPDAPTEVRGEFQPISTSVPGLEITEHLPRIAKWMDRLTLVRSLSHAHPTHCVAYTLSGIPINPLRNVEDYWPFYASTLDYLWEQEGAARPLGMPRALTLPFVLNSRSTNQSHRGLTPAWLGSEWEPVVGEFVGQASREQGFPSGDGAKAILSRYDPFDGITPDSKFQLTAMRLAEHAAKVTLPHRYSKTTFGLPAGVSGHRFNLRRDLLAQMETARRATEAAASGGAFDRYQRMALEMIASPRCANALDVTRESTSVRERYGDTLFGQSTLAARRLVESGARVVTVYWDEYGPANTAWDTHVNNFPRLKEGLCPTLDQVFPALLEDLDQRGLLDETLVLLLSEHGRTPKIGTKPGGSREHWAGAYCGILAGAGIRQGQVIGSTDAQAGYPAERPLDPKDILATLYHLMGFDPQTTRTYDHLNRPHSLLPFGEVVDEALA